MFGDLTKSTKALDGIFGFGRQDTSVISQLSSRKITPKVFSHCLKGDGNGGGIFVLGEILDPRVVYTPLVPSQYVYLLKDGYIGILLPFIHEHITHNIYHATCITIRIENVKHLIGIKSSRYNS